MDLPLFFIDATLKESRPSLAQEEAEPPQIKKEPEEPLVMRTRGDNLSGKNYLFITDDGIALVNPFIY